MDPIIKSILEKGVRAPSGDNCQPWRFEVRSNEIKLYNLPERDASLYSWGQRPSYIAHGAWLENVFIAAAHYGRAVDYELFPDSTNPNLVAKLSLREGKNYSADLFEAIDKRATNRKPYKKEPLPEEIRQEILETGAEIGEGEVRLAEEPDKIKALGRIAAVNEEILFHNRRLHEFFFDHINWTKEEDEKRRLGFSVDTFEIPPPAKMMFKLARNWRTLQFMNKLGFAKLVAKQNSKTYGAAAAMGIITVPQNTPKDFLAAGRILERLWLKLTSRGLSLQPLTGIIFLNHRITAGEGSEISEKQKAIVLNAYNLLKSVFNINNKIIAIMFRAGDGGLPTARTHRLDVKKWGQGGF